MHHCRRCCFPVMGLSVIVVISVVVILFPANPSVALVQAFQQQQQQLQPSSNLFQHPHRRCVVPKQRSSSSSTTTTTTQLDAFLPANSMVSVVDNFWKSSPYASAALTCAVKGSIADLVAQKLARTSSEQEEHQQVKALSVVSNNTDATTTSSSSSSSLSQQDSPDWKRNIAYVIYGSIYQGMIQEYLFNRFYPMLFGYGTDIRTVIMKVAFNLLVHSPFITIPIAYLVKAVVYKDSFREAMAKYWLDIKHHGLLKKFFMLWGPIQCITFSIVPEHYRISFIAAISFFWMVILSLTASKPSPTTTTLRPKFA